MATINKAKRYLEDVYDDEFGVFLMTISIGIFVIGIIIIMWQVFDIVTCITFPEKLIIKELTVIYSSMK